MMAGMKIAPLVALASLGLLAACGGGSPTNGGPVVSGVPDAGSSSRAETAMLPPGTGHLAPEALKGLTATQTESRLGPPSFRRRDPPAEIWQYRVRACTLDLFLYDEGDDRVVTHFAVRTPGGGTISDPACLDEVLAQRTERPTS